MSTEYGRSGAVAPSGCQPSASAAPLRSASSQSGIPNAVNIARLRAAFEDATARALEPSGDANVVALSRSTVFGLLDAAGQFLTFGAAAVRGSALEEAAQIADVWADTKPNLKESTDPGAARAFAAVASHTGETIAAAIRALAASCDTHPQGGDANAAPFMSGAVGEAETPK